MKSLIPNLLVENVEQTLDYYTDLFDFITIQTLPSKKDEAILEWAMVKHADVLIMFQAVGKSIDEDFAKEAENKAKQVSLYIEAQDIHQLYDTLSFRGVELLSELENTLYDTIEFSILDINSYVITFFQKTI